MNQIFDLPWRKGVTALLLVALVVSLVSFPTVYAEEGEAATTEAAASSVSSASSGAEESEPESVTAAPVENDSTDTSDDGIEGGADVPDKSDETEALNEDMLAESSSTVTESHVDEPAAEETIASSTPSEEDSELEELRESATTSTEMEIIDSASAASGGGSTDEADDQTDTLGVTTLSSTTTPEEEASESDIFDSTTTAQSVTELTSSTTEVSATTSAVAVQDASSSASSTTTTIESGTAVALANIINIVNSNFINSDGVVFFSNFLDVVTEALDLRALYNSLADFGCSLTSCSGDSTTVNMSNNALIENFLLLQALTGGNLIAGADTGVISTGDAYAGLNLINVANMNFIDSNYLLVTLNAFNDVNGDIIFPSTDLLLSSLAYSPDSANIDITNNASVTNDVTTDADSGGNALQTTNGGTITSGATGATTNVFNQINSSLIGGQNITIMFRIHGDWVGEVFGAPDDLLWTQGPDGSILLFDSNGSSGAGNVGPRDVTATNNAGINNNINVVALTGDNQITGAETGLISTGNAYAGANIVNLANGNVIGRNWVLAIVNIFGDFKGNIAFGRPDLWVGEMVDAPAKVKNGSLLNYKFTVINNGDSPATNVVLEDTHETSHLTLKQASMPYTTTEDGKLRFAIGKIPRGGAVEISYQAEVTGAGEGQELTNTVTVKGRETDNNLRDNSDTATVETYRSQGGSRPREVVREVKGAPLLSGVMNEETDTLQVKRVFKTFPLTAQYPSMRQVVVLYNPTSHAIPGVTFDDVLRAPDGSTVQTESWDLGEVLPGEEIELGYTLSFSPNAEPGTYTLHTRIKTAEGGEDMRQNGTIIYTTGLIPETLPSLIEDLKLHTPNLPSMPASFTSSLTDSELDMYQDFAALFTEGGVVLPNLSGHSMSTATRQQDTPEGLRGWLSRLYAYLSSLVSKVAPAIALAWSDGREL